MNEELLKKLLLVVIAALLAVCGAIGSLVAWHTKNVHSELVGLRADVKQAEMRFVALSRVVDVEAGINPYAEIVPAETTEVP